jgi:hypothetical protein
MPHSLNIHKRAKIHKGAKIGQRQIDLANKLHAAGLLSDLDRQRVISRRTAGFVDVE